jgi:hypothetical protein
LTEQIMIKKPFHAAAAALALAALGWAPAQAATTVGFVGALAPANFVSSSLGTLSGAGPISGSALFTATALTLTGGDTQDPVLGCAGGLSGDVNSPCRFQTRVSGKGQISFNYSYLTNDSSGPQYDIFGALVDGTMVPLSDPGGPLGQIGNRSFSFNNSFGWFMNCTDCVGGNAMVTIDSVSLTTVAEPGSLALALAACVLLGGLRHRQGTALAT